MQFTVSWLKKHLDFEASVSELAEKLTSIGLEVDKVIDRQDELKNFIVGHVISAEKHPDADKLQVLQVDYGTEKPIQVICGAHNARFDLKGVFAPEGTHIPGTDVKLKKGKIRGVESFGMLCSERELCLSDDHDGIIELDQEAVIGSQASTYLGLDDPLIDIEITPNRGDCLGVRGIARDLAAAGFGTLKPLALPKIKDQFPCPVETHLTFDTQGPTPCPAFATRLIKNVKNSPSPDFLQKDLQSVGLRPISSLVDITNYMTIDQNRPLHVFDYDKIQGHIGLRLSKKGESFKALDGEIYELDEGMTVITDDSGVISLAGIMGGETTSCTENTTNVLVECALFDPIRTAYTGRALNIHSDARFRFERTVDFDSVLSGLDQACQFILNHCGGEISATYLAGSIPTSYPSIDFRPSYFKKIIGLDLEASAMISHLKALGFEIDQNKADEWGVTPPSWRSDVTREIDIIEEIIRINGYDTIPSTALEADSYLPHMIWSDKQLLIHKARQALTGSGLLETINWSFVSKQDAALFGCDNQELILSNPINSELDMMRPSILPHLIRSAGHNSDNGYPDCAFFEIGPCYENTTPEGQSTVIAGLRSGLKSRKSWNQEVEKVSCFDVKKDVMITLSALGVQTANLKTVIESPSYYHPGRSGSLVLGKMTLAHFGEIHPYVMKKMGLKGRFVGFEVFLDQLPQQKKKKNKNKASLSLSTYQNTVRDFAFILDKSQSAESVIKSIQSAARNVIKDITLFDIYEGDNIDSDKKSLAFSVVLEPKDHTFTEEEIDQISTSIVTTVAKNTGGVLRS